MILTGPAGLFAAVVIDDAVGFDDIVNLIGRELDFLDLGEKRTNPLQFIVLLFRKQIECLAAVVISTGVPKRERGGIRSLRAISGD